MVTIAKRQKRAFGSSAAILPVRCLSKEAVRPRWIRGDKTLRVIVLVKATNDSEAGIVPSTELLEAMGKYNESWSTPASFSPARVCILQ
jgi:hypothetical protein